MVKKCGHGYTEWPGSGLAHSRKVLLQAHGLPAVVEGVQVRSEEDVVILEEELDAHVHVVCGVQVGIVSPRGKEAWHCYPTHTQTQRPNHLALGIPTACRG